MHEFKSLFFLIGFTCESCDLCAYSAVYYAYGIYRIYSMYHARRAYTQHAPCNTLAIDHSMYSLCIV